MAKILRRVANLFLHPLGWEIQRVNRVKNPRRTEMQQVLSHIAAKGFEPKTVIDVGVGRGTYPLYEVFPEATHLLVEPR